MNFYKQRIYLIMCGIGFLQLQLQEQEDRQKKIEIVIVQSKLSLLGTM